MSIQSFNFNHWKFVSLSVLGSLTYALIAPISIQAKPDCPNSYWINPKTRQVECLNLGSGSRSPQPISPAKSSPSTSPSASPVPQTSAPSNARLTAAKVDSQIKRGMTKKEVWALIGKPMKESKGAYYKWYWPQSSSPESLNVQVIDQELTVCGVSLGSAQSTNKTNLEAMCKVLQKLRSQRAKITAKILETAVGKPIDKTVLFERFHWQSIKTGGIHMLVDFTKGKVLSTSQFFGLQ
ncbi:MAG: hypothetical protein WCP16_23640 [Pseudanabaena sp. ELA645]|jgi:outer membrane protein assembly factor BamE (lipoprotein component of BamABCDE complex)